MADEAQVKLLKQKGVEAWNKWRKENPDTKPNLKKSELIKINIDGADLHRADLSEINLENSSLVRAKLSGAKLAGANLSTADLSMADLFMADLRGSNLRGAILNGADLAEASLANADLTFSILIMTNLTGAYVAETDFTDSTMANTLLGTIDLSSSKGLNTISHSAPSVIGIDSIFLSGGNIPEIFLRGAGVPEPFIAQMKSLVAAMSPIEFYSCFISYSSKNQEFAERLHADLRSKNVRCWFAPEDLKIGDRLRPAFDEAIRIHDKLMVLLSESSVSSEWVEKEVETAFEKERREKRTVLFPIRLDHAVMETDEAWAADIRRTRHIGDFTDWQNHDSYKKAFERLLRDLKAEG